MKSYNIASIFLVITIIFSTIYISIEAPSIESIEIEIQEAVYLRSALDDGTANIKLTIRNKSSKVLRIRESTLISHVVGYKLGEGIEKGITILPGKERDQKFTIQENWKYIPLYEPEWQQRYDFILEILDMKRSKLEFNQIIPTPRVYGPKAFTDSSPETNSPQGIEFRVMNVSYPVNYLETAKKPPRLTDYTNVTIKYKIINHGSLEAILDPVTISSHYGGYELGQAIQRERIRLKPGAMISGSIGIDEDWSPVRTIEFGMDFFYGFKTRASREFVMEDIYQLTQIHTEQPVYIPLVDTNLEYLERFSDKIYNTGIPPDSIPPIETPQYIGLNNITFLNDHDIVYLMETEVARVYPRKVMLWHEIVNDYINERNISITYCPLTESAVGYSVQFMGNTTTFGTSGKLLNSNLVLYDRVTKSMWPQILGVSVEGKWKGVKLEPIPLLTTTWGRVKDVYPNAEVLSTETGTYRDYNEDPYSTYTSRGRIQFPVSHRDHRMDYHTKVIGVKHKNATIAIVKDYLRSENVSSFELGGVEVTARYDNELDAVRVYSDSVQITYFELYWFSWYAYYPDTGLIGGPLET